jgi:hypothetical protein
MKSIARRLGWHLHFAESEEISLWHQSENRSRRTEHFALCVIRIIYGLMTSGRQKQKFQICWSLIGIGRLKSKMHTKWYKYSIAWVKSLGLIC